MENPWIGLPAVEPFVLPDDELLIHEHNRKMRDEGKENFEVYLKVFPEPYAGNPQGNVVLLNLNPGFYPNKTPQFALGDGNFQLLTKANYVHANQEYPFFHLDPRISASPGAGYYRPRLRRLIELFDTRRVAEEILVVEFFPYFTRHWDSEIVRVPSQEYSFFLVREAMKRNAVIIVMRGKKEWLEVVRNLKEYQRYYTLNYPPCTYITPRNCPEGWDEIIKVLSS